MQEYSSNADFTHEKVHKIINADKTPVKNGTKSRPLKRVAMHTKNYCLDRFGDVYDNDINES